MSLTITNPPLVEESPFVIVRKSLEPYESDTMRYDGPLARVNVTTGADYNLVRMLRYGIDYFAPASGNGLLVKPELLKR
jgi:hypothetical protein